jgi:hypothetical protein
VSRKPALTLDTVEAILGEAARAKLLDFSEELSEPAADADAIKERFLDWAAAELIPAFQNADTKPPGVDEKSLPHRVFALLKRQHDPEPDAPTSQPVALEELPTPLVRAVLEWRNEKEPFRRVNRLIDTIEVLCKLHTVAGLSSFVDEAARNPELVRGKDDQLSRACSTIAFHLRKPSLGHWWQMVRETNEALGTLGEVRVRPGNKLRDAFDGNDSLITLRNKYAHGATPPPQACNQHLQKYSPVMDTLLEQAHSLSTVTLLVKLEDGSVLQARGKTPQPLKPSELSKENAAALKPGHCYLASAAGKLLDLHPLLSFEPDSPVSGDQGEKQTPSDGSFFFYDSLPGHVTLLNYPLARHKQDKTLRETLLERFRIEEWKKWSGLELSPFRSLMEDLTEDFVGRQQELDQLAGFLAGTDRGFVILQGPPGVGKSSVLARMSQALLHKDQREEAWAESPKKPDPGTQFRVVEYFIRRDSTDTAAKMLDSLNQRLDARFQLPSTSLGTTDEEQQRAFNERLDTISSLLEGTKERMVLIIDGLDEARPDDPLMSVLPRKTWPNIIVLYGSRPLHGGFYDELEAEPEQRSECLLGGLGLEDTRALLYAHVNKYELEDSYAETVLERSEGNPLNLKLLCQGLEQQTYKLNDRAALPRHMEELYQKALAGMEAHSPEAIDLLSLLAASRDFVSVAMAAELMGTTEKRLDPTVSACMELLYEDPLTENLIDYQLFHESLREHLQDKRSREVNRWEEKLAEWSSDWQRDEKPRHEAERLRYAMAYAVPHQVACRDRAQQAFLEKSLHKSSQWMASVKQSHEVRQRGEKILALVENPAWREQCFKARGNGVALRRAIRHAQDVLRELDQDGSNRERLLRFARWRHDEPERFYNEQLDRLRAERLPLEEVVQLAEMGETPRDRVMLALSALWTPKPPANLPVQDGFQIFRQSMSQWLEESQDTALKKMWELTLKSP